MVSRASRCVWSGDLLFEFCCGVWGGRGGGDRETGSRGGKEGRGARISSYLLNLYSMSCVAVPNIELDSRGKDCLVAIDMVLAKLWDSCREAERRDEVDRGGRIRKSSYAWQRRACVVVLRSAVHVCGTPICMKGCLPLHKCARMAVCVRAPVEAVGHGKHAGRWRGDGRFVSRSSRTPGRVVG